MTHHLLERAAPDAAAVAAAGLAIGTLAGLDDEGRPLVVLAGAEPLPARTLLPLGAAHAGREVAVLFEGGDPSRPVVLGLLQPPAAPAAGAGGVHVEADGERVVVTAEREVVLRCGAASITLTRAGKVLIAGEYVLTRARGVNRIRGGSVQIN